MTVLKYTTPIAFAGEYGNRFGPKFLFDGADDAEAARLSALAAADKAAADKAAADKVAADKAAADKAAADKIIADKAAADQAAADKLALSKMSDSEAALLKEVMANKEKAKTLAAEKAALEAQLAAFSGIDPAKAKEMLDLHTKSVADKAAADKLALEKAGEFDRLKAMMAEEHKKELTAAQELIKSNSSALDMATKTINDLTVGASFNTSKFVLDELVLTPRVAREVYGQHFDVEGGETVAYDKPKGAESRTKLVDSSGTALGFEAAIAKLVDMAPDKDQLLKSKLKPGASSATNNAPYVRPSSQNSSGELTGMNRMVAALNAGALKKAT